MYCVTVTFRIREGHEEAFLKRVRQQAQDSLEREPGCSVFDVWTDSEGPGAVFLYEIYDSRAAFDMHLESDHYRAFSQEVKEWVADKVVRTWSRRA